LEILLKACKDVAPKINIEKVKYIYPRGKKLALCAEGLRFEASWIQCRFFQISVLYLTFSKEKLHVCGEYQTPTVIWIPH
jgi:hypothetical protein